MADDVISNPGAGGATFAADEIGGVFYPRSKIVIGADGVNGGDVSSANPLPVNDAGGSLTVDGTVAVSGTVAVTQSGVWDEVGINDSGNSITVDNATISVVGGGTEATAQRVTIASDSTGVLSVDDNGASLTVDGTVAVTNGGTFVVQENGAVLTALQLIDDVIFTDDAAFTPATSKVAMIGAQADETSPDSVNEGDAGALRMSLERFLLISPKPVATGEGLDVFRSLDLDESEEEVKATPGHLYKIRITNRRTTPIYVKLYNDTAANVIVGTTVPMDTIEVPGNASDHTVLTESFGGQPLKFSAALCVAATTGFADNDTGAPAANDCIVSCYYK